MRHAKASIGEAGMPDVKRKLTKIGINDAQKVVKDLQTVKVSFDFIICSHAIRALETAKIIASGTAYPVDKIICDKRIYHRDVSRYFNVLYELDEAISSVLMVGHNPVITEFANYFLEEKIMYLTTSGMVCIEIDTKKWTDINLASHKTKFMISHNIL
jgi:phosphohistidine phosphatase